MRKALIVGIDNYTQCPLHGCCNDAEHMAQELSCNYFTILDMAILIM